MGLAPKGKDSFVAGVIKSHGHYFVSFLLECERVKML